MSVSLFVFLGMSLFGYNYVFTLILDEDNVRVLRGLIGILHV